MAYPGVFMLDDASIFRALQTTAKKRRPHLHARGKRQRDRRNYSTGAGPRKDGAEISRSHPPHHGGGRSRLPRDCVIGNGGSAHLHLCTWSCNEALEKVREARDRGLPVYAETCPQYLYLSIENFDVPDFEGAKYVFTPPLREKVASGKTLDWPQARSSAGRLYGSLSLLLKNRKELGRGDFTKNSERRPGDRTPHESDLLRRRRSG